MLFSIILLWVCILHAPKLEPKYKPTGLKKERECYRHLDSWPSFLDQGPWLTELYIQAWSLLKSVCCSLCPTLYDLIASRQEYYSGLPFPSPGGLPNPEIGPRSPALQAGSLPTEPLGTDQQLFNEWMNEFVNEWLSERTRVQWNSCHKYWINFYFLYWVIRENFLCKDYERRLLPLQDLSCQDPSMSFCGPPTI